MSRTRLHVFVWFAGAFSLVVICIFHHDGLALTRCTLVLTTAPAWIFDITDKFEGLGLFFDTYKNNRPGTVFPYIMAMNGDGNTPYDKDNDGKANEVAGCSVCISRIIVLAKY